MSVFGMVVATEKTFWGIDSFGWGGILFRVLLIGIPCMRYFLPAVEIPNWPMVSARVTKAVVISGLPSPPFALTQSNSRLAVPFHCRASYSFLVDGKRLEG